MLGALLLAWVLMQQLGAPIVRPPEPAPQSPIVSPPAPQPSNVTVNVTAPAPDPVETRNLGEFMIANTEYDHVQVPVDIANSLLKGNNIWTRTPTDAFDQFIVAGMRNSAKNAALGLFLLGILWTGVQLLLGAGLHTTSYQQLLPMVIAGFLLAVYADTIAMRAVALNNWLCDRLAEPSLFDFTGNALTLPPAPDTATPGAISVPAGLFSGLLTSLLYAIVLIILELKLIYREAVLLVSDVVMPISGVLWAFGITRGWGVRLFQLFFGWLFGQPLVVACLAIAGSLLTLTGLTEGPAQVFVKVAVLFVALKAVSLFASGGLGGGGLFGVAGLLFLLRRARGLGRGTATGGTSASQSSTPSAPAQNTAAVQPGGSGSGTGAGTAATGRPWRPAMGTA